MWLSLLLTSELTAAQSLQDRIDYGTDWWFWIDDLPAGQGFPVWITQDADTEEYTIQFFAPDAKDTLTEETWGSADFDDVDADGNDVLTAINFANGDVFEPELTDDFGWGDQEPTGAFQKYKTKTGFFAPTNYYLWQYPAAGDVESPFISEEPNYDPTSVLNVEISSWNDNQI